MLKKLKFYSDVIVFAIFSPLALFVLYFFIIKSIGSSENIAIFQIINQITIQTFSLFMTSTIFSALMYYSLNLAITSGTKRQLLSEDSATTYKKWVKYFCISLYILLLLVIVLNNEQFQFVTGLIAFSSLISNFANKYSNDN